MAPTNHFTYLLDHLAAFPCVLSLGHDMYCSPIQSDRNTMLEQTGQPLPLSRHTSMFENTDSVFPSPKTPIIYVFVKPVMASCFPRSAVPSPLLQQQHLLVQHAKQALDFLSNNLELFGHLTCDQRVRVQQCVVLFLKLHLARQTPTKC